MEDGKGIAFMVLNGCKLFSTQPSIFIVDSFSWECVVFGFEKFDVYMCVSHEKKRERDQQNRWELPLCQ